MATKIISVKSLFSKLALLIPCLVLCSLLIVFAKWCLGNAISTQVTENTLAEFSVTLAPSDPQTHYALAVVNEKTFLPEDLEKSVSEYQRALALSPHDYRLWLSLATALERIGDSNGADVVFKRSLELAPNYAQVAWAYGNYMLRQGNTDAAFVEIRKAAESNNTYLQPAVSAAWQFLRGDLTEVRKVFGASPEFNSMLASFLASEKRFDESMEIWTALDEKDKKTRFKETGKQIFQDMVAGKRYRNAIEVFNGIASEPEQKYAKETISNGGFEKDVSPEQADVFDWQLGPGLQPQILFDEGQKFEGNRSLVVVFNSSDGRDFRTVSQTVVIQPGKNYELSFAYKSDLKTASTLRWEVIDSSGNILSETEAAEQRSNWNKTAISFTSPEMEDSVTIRLARVKCAPGICPITGRIWFDDFRLRF